MVSGREVRTLLTAIAIALVVVPVSWGQQSAPPDQLLQRIAEFVLAHNPILVSRQRLTDDARQIPDRPPGLLVPGLSLSASVYSWNPYTNLFAVLPSASVGLSLSFGDPSRDLDIIRLKEARVADAQALQEAKDAALATLFQRVRDILKLKAEGKNLTELRNYLRDYSAVADTQRSAQSISPDKLWDLRQRIADAQTQLDTLDGELQTTMMETALSLGGDGWQELLGLLRQLVT